MLSHEVHTLSKFGVISQLGEIKIEPRSTLRDHYVMKIGDRYLETLPGRLHVFKSRTAVENFCIKHRLFVANK